MVWLVAILGTIVSNYSLAKVNVQKFQITSNQQLTIPYVVWRLLIDFFAIY
jgi:hypothetical protein